MECPDAILGTRDLLGHENFNTTDQYYLQSHTIYAGREYAKVLERRIGPAASTRPVTIQSLRGW
jgi:hypothetical protein